MKPPKCDSEPKHEGKKDKKDGYGSKPAADWNWNTGHKTKSYDWYSGTMEQS